MTSSAVLNVTIRRMTLLILMAAAGLLATGCTRVHRSFPGQDPDLVWTALVAVAETPDYRSDDPEEHWNVRVNEVWLDPRRPRIEIYRQVERILRPAHARPMRQHRSWKFQVLFEREDPPHVIFSSRGFGVPARAHEEADRYFADVWDILDGGGVGPDAGVPHVPVPPATRVPEAPDRPIVEIEDLEPSGR